jgi:hypothetical protein
MKCKIKHKIQFYLSLSAHIDSFDVLLNFKGRFSCLRKETLKEAQKTKNKLF